MDLPRLASVVGNINFATAAAPAMGLQVMKIPIPLTATDMTPYVAQGLAAGADSMIATVGPASLVASIKALQQSGKDLTSGNFHYRRRFDIVHSEDGASRRGEHRHGVAIVSNFLSPTDTSNPIVKQYLAELQAANQPNDPLSVTLLGLGAWAGMHMLADRLSAMHLAPTSGECDQGPQLQAVGGAAGGEVGPDRYQLSRSPLQEQRGAGRAPPVQRHSYYYRFNSQGIPGSAGEATAERPQVDPSQRVIATLSLKAGPRLVSRRGPARSRWNFRAADASHPLLEPDRFRPVLEPDHLQFLLLGLATGALYAIFALGVVLTYRASGVLNFAIGSLGAIGAYFFYSLRDDHHVNWVLALALALALGALIGVAMHFLVMVLLRKVSVLAKLISTLALVTLATGIIDLVWGDQGGRSPRSILPTNPVKLSSQITIPEERLILIGIVLALTVILRFAYTRTMFGLATSAVAESRRVAAASGWSPNRIEVANFVITGVFSAGAAILLVPIIGLSVTGLTLVVLPALAAAMVGRFSSFVVTLIAALGIGVATTELSLFQPDITGLFRLVAGRADGTAGPRDAARDRRSRRRLPGRRGSSAASRTFAFRSPATVAFRRSFWSSASSRRSQLS